MRRMVAFVLVAIGTACTSAAGPDPIASDVPEFRAPTPPRAEFVAVAVESIELRAAADDGAAPVMVGGADAGRAFENPLAIASGTVVAIVDEVRGPEERRWLRVVAPVPAMYAQAFRTGWIPFEVDGTATTAAPDQDACPSVEEDWPAVLGAGDPFRLIHCLAGARLTLEGRPTDTGDCADRGWFECSPISLRGVPLYLRVSQPDFDAEDARITVLGHVDDPGAVECGNGLDEIERPQAILECRTRFVALAVSSDALPRATVSALRPEVMLESVEPYADGEWIRYSLRVTNASEFADELFAPSADLPACGAHAPAARSWIDVLRSDGGFLSRFCAPGDAAVLSALTFAIQSDADPPAGVIVEIHDREASLRYRSEVVPIDR